MAQRAFFVLIACSTVSLPQSALAEGVRGTDDSSPEAVLDVRLMRFKRMRRGFFPISVGPPVSVGSDAVP